MITLRVTTGITLRLREGDSLPVVHPDMLIRNVKYEDLQPGQLFAIAKKTNYEDDNGYTYISEDQYKLTYEFGFLVAAYLGDNRVSNDEDCIKFYSRNELHLDHLQDYAATAGFIPMCMYAKKKRSKLIGIKIRSENVCNWFRIHFNNPDHNREIPNWVYHAPEAFRRGLIDGLLCSDGTVNGTKGRNRNVPVVYIILVSESLAEKVILLLKTLGIASTIIRWAPNKRRLAPYYGVSVNIKDLDNIKITDPAKRSFISRMILEYDPQINSSDIVPWSRRVRREIVRRVDIGNSLKNAALSRVTAKRLLADYPQIRDIDNELVQRWIRWVDSKKTQFVKIKAATITDEPLLYKSYLDRIIGIHNEEEMDLVEI